MKQIAVIKNIYICILVIGFFTIPVYLFNQVRLANVILNNIADLKEGEVRENSIVRTNGDTYIIHSFRLDKKGEDMLNSGGGIMLTKLTKGRSK